MFMKRNALSAVCGLCIGISGLSACADDSSDDGGNSPPGWIVGLAYISAPDPYVGSVEDASTVVPLVGYIGERLTWIGPSIEYRLLEVSALQLGIEARYRFEGFSDDNMLSGELDRRDGSFDVGFTLDYGPFALDVVTDASGTHNGSEARLGAGLEFDLSDRLSVAPSVSATYKNAKLTNYYYGVNATEATANRPAYAPGSALNFAAGVELNYTLSQRSLITIGLDLEHLDNSLRASPLINSNRQWSAFAGVLFDVF